MFRALFIKELREIWWIGLLPFAMMLYYAAGEAEFGRVGMGFGFRRVANPAAFHLMPFSSTEFAVQTLLWGSVAAGGLALWQTFRESQARTWHFLLHRPVNRSLIMWTKIAASAAVFAIAILLPVSALSIWGALPGTHASPFRWSLVYPVWLAAAAGGTAYLAVFFSGLRRGRLLGARWWPSIGIVTVSSMICIAMLSFSTFQLWFFAGLIIIDAVLIVTIRDELLLADFN